MNREFNKDARLLFTTPNANALLYILLRYVLKALEDNNVRMRDFIHSCSSSSSNSQGFPHTASTVAFQLATIATNPNVGWFALAASQSFAAFPRFHVSLESFAPVFQFKVKRAQKCLRFFAHDVAIIVPFRPRAKRLPLVRVGFVFRKRVVV